MGGKVEVRAGWGSKPLLKKIQKGSARPKWREAGISPFPLWTKRSRAVSKREKKQKGKLSGGREKGAIETPLPAGSSNSSGFEKRTAEGRKKIGQLHPEG